MANDGRINPGLVDDINLGILYLLQQDARGITTSMIGECLGVSSSTVGNRINRMEEEGIITGYFPTLDYEKAGFDQHLLITGTAPLEELESVGHELLDVNGVTNVRELLTNQENISLEVIGKNRREIEQTISELNAMGVHIERMQMMRQTYTRPVNNYGKKIIQEGNEQ